MPTYKFPQFDIEIVNPTITVDGQAGTTIVNNVPNDEAYADIILESEGVKFGLRLEGSPKPIDWTMESLSIWVGQQLAKYEITE